MSGLNDKENVLMKHKRGHLKAMLSLNIKMHNKDKQ
jgi:hypothetical protein